MCSVPAGCTSLGTWKYWFCVQDFIRSQAGSHGPSIWGCRKWSNTSACHMFALSASPGAQKARAGSHWHPALAVPWVMPRTSRLQSWEINYLGLWEKAEWRSEAIGVFSLWELCSSHSNLLEGKQLVTWKGPYQLKARFHSKAETTRETSVCLTIRSRLCNTLSQREGWIAKDFIWMHTPAPLGLAFS